VFAGVLTFEVSVETLGWLDRFALLLALSLIDLDTGDSS